MSEMQHIAVLYDVLRLNSVLQRGKDKARMDRELCAYRLLVTILPLLMRRE
jgi:hypothetical protein